MLGLLALAVSSIVLGEDFPMDASLSSAPEPRSLSASAPYRAAEAQQFCTLSKTDSPSKRPLLSHDFLTSTQLYPLNGGSGDILIPVGSQFTASCAPASNLLETFRVNRIQVTCRPGGGLMVNGQETRFENLGCRHSLKENVTENMDPGNGKGCYGDSVNISIEFSDQQRKFPLFTLCHDKATLNTLMSKHVVRGGSIDTAEISNNRPNFKEAQFFKTISAQSAYSQLGQVAMVKSLLSSSARLANEYIDPSQSFYFARGHLVPDGDLIYAAQQNSTYYYVNVFPQWQSINNGNWKSLEMAIRRLASSQNATLTVYTGGFQILTLKDLNNNPTPIYLARDPTSNELVVPVPKLTFKIIHDPKKRSGVAIIVVNNPHQLGITSGDIICKNICDQVKWVNWDVGNVRKGFTYCCSVKEFARKVPFVPKITGYVRLMS